MMEVPCCAGLNAIVDRARKDAGSPVPVEQVIISVKGEVIPPSVAVSGSGRA
jgi:hypothetical protein